MVTLRSKITTTKNTLCKADNLKTIIAISTTYGSQLFFSGVIKLTGIVKRAQVLNEKRYTLAQPNVLTLNILCKYRINKKCVKNPYSRHA